MQPSKDRYRVVVVGGGVTGLSVAYHLARCGCPDVLLLERNELSSGTSWHAAGIVGPLRATMNLTEIAKYALTLFRELEDETGQHTGFKQTGGFWLAESEQRLIELKRIKAMGDMHGLHARFVSKAEARERLPVLYVDDLAGLLWVEEDGQVNPVDLCMAYARGARARGVEILEHTAVNGFTTDNGRVTGVKLADDRRIRCDAVVNCTGLWAREVGAWAGVSVPLQAVEHMYVVTEPIPGLPQPCPLARDLGGALYIKEDAGKLVIGTFEHNARLWDHVGVSPDQSYVQLPENWDHLEPMLTAAQHRIPCLADTGLRHFMNGPESFTPDTKQVMGEAPELKNYYVAAGLNSLGIMSSAGVGRAMARWIIDGRAPMDLWEVDIARFDKFYAAGGFLARRIPEAVANQMAMHWPFKQFKTGRDMRRSPLHDVYAERGAVFGATAGWERPFWYAQADGEREFHYSYGEQTWWPCAERESQNLQHAVALFELSPFTKIRVRGRDAETFLQNLCTANMAVEPGAVVYTLLLNDDGGIEGELTAARLSMDDYMLVSGAATRVKDLAWLKHHVASNQAVTIEDVSGKQGAIGVMGPNARALLRTLTDADVSGPGFPFGTAQSLRVAGHEVRAARVSFVGELGYELYVPNDAAHAVHAALCEAGEEFDLGHAGFFCMDACRLEKGYYHWGHDIGPQDTPYHVGLGFAVDHAKEFVGKDALARRREPGLDYRLLQFRVDAGRPLLLHDEPIYRDGDLVGRTTSGGLGFRTGLALCFGVVRKDKDAKLAELLATEYQIELAGDRFPLIPLSRPPYDPDGLRMRG